MNFGMEPSKHDGAVSRHSLLPWICGVAMLASAGTAAAAVSDVTVSNVTTRALAVVWVSDEAVTSATARIYTDVAGTNQVAATVDVESAAVTGAHANGVVKVNLTGLAANTSYFVQTETTTGSGTVVSPAAGSLVPLITATKTTKVTDTAQPIVNDLIDYPSYGPDGITALAGTLVVASATSLSPYPVAQFIDNSRAILDLNNLFGGDGVSALAAADEIIEFKELRGLNCAGLTDHALVRYAKIPTHEELPVITDLETGDACHLQDTVCDRTVNILDVQFVLNSFGTAPGNCAFNPAADIVADGIIDNQDSDSVLGQFGDSEPF